MSSKRNIGYIIAVVGSLVCLLAFFAMPYLTLGFFGSLTGSQLANVANQVANSNSGSIFGQGYSSQVSSLQLLWLEPLIAAIVLIVAGIQLMPKSTMTPTTSSEKLQQGITNPDGSVQAAAPQAISVQATTTPAASIALIALSGLTLLGVGIRYLSDAQPPDGLSTSYYTGPTIASFYGSGIWFFVIGMIAVLVGGIMAAQKEA